MATVFVVLVMLLFLERIMVLLEVMQFLYGVHLIPVGHLLIQLHLVNI